MKKEYVCECGKKFTSVGSYGGHSGHCKTHLLSIGKYEEVRDAYRRAAATGRAAQAKHKAARKQAKMDLWISEKHACEHCGKVMTEKYGSGRFCSRACANTRKPSLTTKSKISAGLATYHSAIAPNKSNKKSRKSISSVMARNSYLESPNHCSVCGVALPYEKRFRKTCGDECFYMSLSSAGKHSSSVSIKRSKNEVAFCELCESHFGKENVLHNVPMFNGWDADVIIPKYKLAILWNGPWHYKKITAKHSLEQVQNRDRLKINEIVNYGFIPYIIKDTAKHNKDKVLTEFNNLLAYIDSLDTNELL